MKKIKILHILDNLHTGGAERIVFSYYQHFDTDKIQVDFVITENDDGTKGMLEDSVLKMGGNIFRVPRKRKGYIKHLIAAHNVIKSGKYDIIHSHLDELSAFYLLFALFSGTKIRICHSHLAGADRGFSVELLCLFLKPLMNIVTTHKFACGKDAAIALWGKRAVKKEKVHIMNNAIDTDLFSYNETIRNDIRKKYNLSDCTVLGTVGRLSYQKNSIFVIDVFYQYKLINTKSKLLIVGDGELESEMRKKVEDYGIKEDVIFTVNRTDVNQLMMAMDIFLLPSRFEGLPIVLVEAQSVGLSCYVSDKVTTEIKINPNIYYLPITDSTELWAKEIAKSYNNDFNRILGRENIINANYGINNEAVKMQNYYLSLIEERK